MNFFQITITLIKISDEKKSILHGKTNLDPNFPSFSPTSLIPDKISSPCLNTFSDPKYFSPYPHTNLDPNNSS